MESTVKSSWIIYCSRTTHEKGICKFHVFCLDTETQEIIGFYSTLTPNFRLVIAMICDSIKDQPAPETFYVTKDWIKELSPYFPTITFKNVANFPRRKKKVLDKYFHNLVGSVLKKVNKDIVLSSAYE